MVKAFCDYVMRVVMEDLYGSGLAHLIILIGGTAAFVSLDFSLHKGESPRRAFIFSVHCFCAKSFEDFSPGRCPKHAAWNLQAISHVGVRLVANLDHASGGAAIAWYFKLDPFSYE